ncbi:retrotran gag 3 domain-containing protein [Citrus sinensis]|uniref:Retrotran gag 3 domain-containing protein n=1 Tax=Citrus sinensis TaxID=2711 RepID=A0ACB8HXF5_CITSI|nr:retrotran gag 3 domain-containing protein [Citrus sinensis]
MANKEKSSSSISSHEDPSNPLFLHHSDHPGVILVSQPLTEDNYNTWSRAMIMALSAKNKIGFIDGSIKHPGDASAAESQHWNRCNDMVKSWLLNSISKEISLSVIYCKLASEIWADLKERLSQVNGPYIFQVEKEIHNLVQDTMSIATYYTKLKALWDELDALCSIPTCSCGSMKAVIQYQQSHKTMKFLMGLNESYSATRGQILLMDPLPNVNKSYSLVLQDERQHAVSSNQTIAPEATELAAKMNSRERKEYKDVEKRKDGKRERPKCDHCGWVGHTVDKCYHIHGFPPDHRNRKGNSKPSANQTSSLAVDCKE